MGTIFKGSADMLGTVYGDRSAAAKAVLDAQLTLMSAITRHDTSDMLIKLTDQLRAANAKMVATPEGYYTADSKGEMLGQIDSAIELLEISQKIQVNAELIQEWLTTDKLRDLSDVDAHIEKSVGITADPRFDIVVVNDYLLPEARERLLFRGYERVLGGSLLDNALSVVDNTKDELADAIMALPYAGSMFPHQVWFVGFADEAVKAKYGAAISERVQKYFLTRATVGRFLKRWFLQLFDNFPVLFDKGVSRDALEGKCAGHSALVVGSGPSLDEVVRTIHDLNPRPIIICALSAVKALWRNNIIPDFVVILDPQQPLTHLEGIDTSKIKAFYVEYSMNPELMNAIDTHVIPFGAGYDVHGFLESWELSGMPFYQTGGSVIHPAFDLAVKLGCTDIGFVGMDLGFVDNRIYAKNTADGHEFQLSQDGTCYLKAQVNEFAENGLVATVQANDGGLLRTSVPLSQYRTWLEDAIKLYQENGVAISCHNFSKRGAVIEGAPYQPITEHKFEFREQLDLESIISEAPKALDPKLKKKLKRKLSIATKNLVAVHNTCERILQKPEKLKLVDKMAKQTGRCDELTMILAQDLLDIEDWMKRATVDVRAKLLQLVLKTKSACEEVSAAYETLANKLS